MLADLARTLQAGDLGPLRALARLHARRGNLDEAVRLYRWCATKVQPVGYWPGDDEVLIPARELLDEVQETLAADRDGLVAVVEDVVSYAGAGDDRFGRDEAAILALEAWTEVLDGAAALERLRDELTVISLTTFDAAPPRRLALAALPLYLKAGEVDRALVCLEVGLCSFDRELFPTDTFLWPDPTRPGYLSSRDLARLWPEDPAARLGLEDLTDAARATQADWSRRSGEALVAWLADERVTPSVAARALALSIWRLAQLGEQAAAGELVAAAEATWGEDALSRGDWLFLVDAARHAGRDELADAVQARLFEAGELHVERLAEVVRATLEAEGPAAALAQAEGPLAWSLHPELLEVALEAAEGAGQEQRKLELQALIDDADAARAELERLDEEERARQEASAS